MIFARFKFYKHDDYIGHVVVDPRLDSKEEQAKLKDFLVSHQNHITAFVVVPACKADAESIFNVGSIDESKEEPAKISDDIVPMEDVVPVSHGQSSKDKDSLQDIMVVNQEADDKAYAHPYDLDENVEACISIHSRAFAIVVEHLQYLQEIEFHHVEFTYRSAQVMANFIRNSKALTALDLSLCDIPATAWVMLQQAIRENQDTISKLVLMSCRVADGDEKTSAAERTSELCKALQGKSFNYLDIDLTGDDSFSHASIIPVFPMMNVLRNLICLVFLEASEFPLFVNNIMLCHQLENLEIHLPPKVKTIRQREACGEALAALVRQDEKPVLRLKRLSLHTSTEGELPFTGKVAQQFFTALEKNQTLQELECHPNDNNKEVMDDVAFLALGNMLQRNKVLASFSFAFFAGNESRRKMTSEDGRHAVEESSVIVLDEKLSFSSNRRKFLRAALETNTSITSCRLLTFRAVSMSYRRDIRQSPFFIEDDAHDVNYFIKRNRERWFALSPLYLLMAFARANSNHLFIDSIIVLIPFIIKQAMQFPPDGQSEPFFDFPFYKENFNWETQRQQAACHSRRFSRFIVNATFFRKEVGVVATAPAASADTEMTAVGSSAETNRLKKRKAL